MKIFRKKAKTFLFTCGHRIDDVEEIRAPKTARERPKEHTLIDKGTQTPFETPIRRALSDLTDRVEKRDEIMPFKAPPKPTETCSRKLHVTVTVKKAKELIEIENGFKGTADPFCVVTCNGQKQQTKPWTDKLSDPCWNTSLVFDSFPIADDKKTITIKCELYDFDDLLNETTEMGYCDVVVPLKRAFKYRFSQRFSQRISISFLKSHLEMNEFKDSTFEPFEKVLEKWYPLKKVKSGKVQLHVRVYITPNNDSVVI